MYLSVSSSAIFSPPQRLNFCSLPHSFSSLSFDFFVTLFQSSVPHLRIDFAPRSFSPHNSLPQNTSSRKHLAEKYFRHSLEKQFQPKDYNLQHQNHRKRPVFLYIFSRTSTTVLHKMFSKLSVMCVAALAVVAHAGHESHHHTHTRKNGTVTHHPFPDHYHHPSGHHGPSGSAGYPNEAGTSSGVAPYPTGTGGSSLLSTGASPRLLTTGVPVTTYVTTTIVTKLTTYCPEPTTLTQNGKLYTVTSVYIHQLHDSPPLLTGIENDPHHW